MLKRFLIGLLVSLFLLIGIAFMNDVDYLIPFFLIPSGICAIAIVLIDDIEIQETS